jgi:hypothetical protein
LSGAVLSVLLRVGYRHAVSAPNAEAAFEQVQALAGGALDAADFHAAVAEALARGLIREPIRLPEGSLQCQWRLELTPEGVAAARNKI